ncbi:hypothetical protein C8E00_11058 [Chromohalobacter marismortui]|uniref:Lar family restriction alleviation protein n=1 Tax=Chromohalobacter marismortui TaxID=42055 RepID=A0A4R7NES5_9GAMM|nr:MULTISPECIES: hypothetical protein [Chromohalobacter]MCI0510048.1 hypothetical protein [Chromohalobacter sp.]MCI0593793.1 hypothetical protein [Chromohalobacter sp.]TDU18983.1 hypothetical protein C8E00_11058 [Chromohalobacter marismortui]
MTNDMICPRCGSRALNTPDTAFEWDEVTCIECDEFIDTCLGLAQRAVDYLPPLDEACLKTRAMARHMGMRA